MKCELDVTNKSGETLLTQADWRMNMISVSRTGVHDCEQIQNTSLTY